MAQHIPAPSATLIRFPKSKADANVRTTQRDEKSSIEEAVYYFMRAQRLLGRDRISVELMALGLQLPQTAIEKALRSLAYQKV